MWLEITKEEEELLQTIEEMEAKVKEIDRQIESSRFRADIGQMNGLKDEQHTLQDKIQELQQGILGTRASLKHSVNHFLAAKMPGFGPEMVLAVLQELDAQLDGPFVAELGAIGKKGFLRVLEISADEDIQKAIARRLFVQYKAMIDVGLPAELVGQILVAKASRPVRMPEFKMGNMVFGGE